jgi:hypothetical protein
MICSVRPVTAVQPDKVVLLCIQVTPLLYCECEFNSESGLMDSARTHYSFIPLFLDFKEEGKMWCSLQKDHIWVSK